MFDETYILNHLNRVYVEDPYLFIRWFNYNIDKYGFVSVADIAEHLQCCWELRHLEYVTVGFGHRIDATAFEPTPEGFRMKFKKLDHTR